ncbi:caspase family protein (plasmid) [Paraburkholderia strydomiana]
MRASPKVRAPIAVYSILLLFLVCLSHSAIGMTVKDLPAMGSQPTARDINGDSVPLYKASYALLISNGDYKSGWPKLEQPGKELDALGLVLQKQGFTVRRVSDAKSGQLNAALREFLFDMVKEPDSRVIVFFSGHGYTTKAGMGYLVPTDAPDPGAGENAFRQLALPINELEVLAKETSSRHVLFILDSCFSGSIFTSKSFDRPDAATEKVALRQPYFLGAGQKPVRQFLAAGGAGERLPESSEFIPLLVAALTGTTTISQDGYLTGKELGLWIEQSLPHVTGDRTHPHSDVIQDPKYVFGDMVFQIRAPVPTPVPSQKQTNVAVSSQPVASSTAPAAPGRTESPRYHASLSGSRFVLNGSYEVAYWREGDEIRAEVAGSVWIRPGSKETEDQFCGVQLLIARTRADGGWEPVVESEIKDYQRTVKRTDPGLPVGPLRFVLKVDPKFDPDDVWFVMKHYSPTKGLFGNRKCNETYVPMPQKANGLFLPRDIIAVGSRHTDTCAKADALTTEFDDKAPLSIKSAMNVCYQPPRIVVQVAAGQVKNNGKTVLLLEGLSLTIYPFKDNQWGKPISPRRQPVFNPPILVNPGQTVTLPEVADFEYMISDEVRPQVSPPSHVVIHVSVYDKRVGDDGVALRSVVGTNTGVLGKLANNTSGF